MTDCRPTFCRRLLVPVIGFLAGLLPTLLLASIFHPELLDVLLVWAEFAFGPILSVMEPIFGYPRERPDPMAGISALIYACCLAPTVAHLVRPTPSTGGYAVFGFVAWYFWALVAFFGCCLSSM